MGCTNSISTKRTMYDEKNMFIKRTVRGQTVTCEAKVTSSENPRSKTDSYSTKTFTYPINTEYTQPSKHVNSSSTQKELSYDNSKWLKHALPTGGDSKNFTSADYEEISTSIKESDFTHTGFIQYLAIAWADEKGIVLRPDMFHHLISCEIANDVTENPETYRSIYTKSAAKKDIKIVTSGDDNEFVRLLDLVLNSEIPHKEFKKQMTDIKFVSQPENYELVKRICFASSATPFYNYMRSKCGIPLISIPDVLDDWIKLYEFISKMADIISSECKHVPTSTQNLGAELPIVKYLRKNSIHIKEIIDNFDSPMFLKNKLQTLFYVEDEFRCGSGHALYYIKGWIQDFYLVNSPTLQDYPTHLPYLPYNFEGVGNFSIVSGLISSKVNKDVLEPEYGKIVLKITNQKLFDTIKN